MTGDLWQRLHDEHESRPVGYRFGTRRAIPPAETLHRIRPLLPRAGITRLADITGLDWIGLPVYQAIRPNSRNVSVSQGKGLTRAQAQVSALMESLEGYHAERITAPCRRATVGALRPALPYDPYSLPLVRTTGGVLPRDTAYDPYAPPVGSPSFLRDESPVEWVPATDLDTGAPSWVPRQLCELDYCVEERLTVPLFRASSNGLASGNTVAEAVLHGLCEVIERDALWRNQAARHDPQRHVRLETIDAGLAQGVLQRFARAGMATEVVDMSGPTGLPCFAAYVSHASAPVRYFGAGCHPSRATALLRALTEAAQSRLGYIAGSRDDLYRASYAVAPDTLAQPAPDEAQTGAPRRSFRSAPTLAGQGLPALLREVVGRVRAVTGAAPLAVDLRRPEFDLPVVYVVAPGLQLIPPQRR